MEKTGLKTCERNRRWGVKRLKKGHNIQVKLIEKMEDVALRRTARKVGEEGRKAQAAVGTSEKVILKVLGLLRQKIE